MQTKKFFLTRRILVLISLFLFIDYANAQQTISTTSRSTAPAIDTAFNNAIEAIVKSFPDSFSTIKGLAAYSDWSFRTTVNLPGATEQMLDYFTKEIRCWGSFGISKTEQEAIDLYKSIYKKLAACQFKHIVPGKTIKLKGSSPPVDEYSTSDTFVLNPKVAGYEKLGIYLWLDSRDRIYSVKYSLSIYR